MESIDIAAAAKDAWRSGTQGSSVSYHDFLDRMRNPASFDLVRSIKSFIVSFSFYAATPESDSERFQDFLLRMGAAIRDHPLWAAATEEEIDSALEGVEKYVMTKLFSRTFALSSEDARIDDEISKKICLLQKFVKPEHLDIPSIFHDKSSWLSTASSTRDSGKQAYTEPSCNMDEMIALAWSEPGGGVTFPFMEAEADKLSVGDLKKLLCVYKDVVNKYTRLCKAVRHFSVSTMERRAPDSGKNIRSEQTENHQLYLRKEEEELPDTT